MKSRNTISWILSIILGIVGVLNMVLVDPVPGIVYLALSLACLPWVNGYLKKRIGFSLPFVVRLILFLFFMWYSLAMGEVWENLWDL